MRFVFMCDIFQIKCIKYKELLGNVGIMFDKCARRAKNVVQAKAFRRWKLSKLFGIVGSWISAQKSKQKISLNYDKYTDTSGTS